MNSNATTNDDVLLLTDSAGNMYAIPVGTLERYRVSGEEKGKWEQLLGDDVSGYSMYQNYMTEQLAGYGQAERRQAAEESRMAQMASQASKGADADNAAENVSFYGRFISMLRQPGARTREAGR
jgi:hypothetical protein